MIKKILIANRGEIACRIARTAKSMGIATVAIYSEADVNSLHIKAADEAVFVGPAAAPLSYLNVKRILEAIKMTGADAVHPGYGFLSENAAFAEMLAKNGITFIGPSAEAIKKMGDKIEAKKIAQSAGVNIVPGYSKTIRSPEEAIKIAHKLGYPVILKAAAGGGGKGMRVVHNDSEMEQSLYSARNEAKNNFSDERTFIEKYIEDPRHIEIQLLADQHGNYVCLGERECSIQRHHQKVIEEAPSIFIDEKTRAKMYKQSITLGKAVGYHSAGTVEFIVDAKKNFYFMEMNTRLQVEHPVTELVTGIDIVEQMIRIARGEKLPFKQNDIKIEGHATECRIYAEDATAGFLPSTGKITTYHQPEPRTGLRIDTGIYEGGEVSMFYDAMISKVCTHAPTRDGSIELMRNVLNDYLIFGISHNISGFLQRILSHSRYISGNISTHFIAEEFSQQATGATLDSEAKAVMLSAATYIFLTEQKRALTISGQKRNHSSGIGTRWVVVIDEQSYPITIRPVDDGYKIAFESRKLIISSKWRLGSRLFQCIINQKQYSLQIEFIRNGYRLTFMGSNAIVKVLTPRAAELSKYMPKNEQVNDVTGEVLASMSGMIVGVKVEKGNVVTKGQVLAIIEAMKMENIITSPIDGTVEKIHVSQGVSVSAGDPIIDIA